MAIKYFLRKHKIRIITPDGYSFLITLYIKDGRCSNVEQVKSEE